MEEAKTQKGPRADIVNASGEGIQWESIELTTLKYFSGPNTQSVTNGFLFGVVLLSRCGRQG